jgi:ABC-type lipoprotein export system ATPase subunit
MPTRTVLDNAALGGLGAGMDRSEARHAAIAALRIVGIDSLARKRANTLSGGELQRLAVARAACLGRKFVLADEPTGALDATTTDRVVDVLQALARRDMAVIVATHDTSVAEKCDRVLSLVDGALRDVS